MAAGPQRRQTGRRHRRRRRTARKVLRYAFVVAETGFDPAKISDLYSRICTAHMFEALYRFDYLARLPSKVVPHVAAAMPEIADDFKTWTIRIRPGVYFADDPAFKGKPRELVAADFAYAWKRHYDPVNKDPNYTGFKEEGVLGVDELRQAAIRDKKPFDYDSAGRGRAGARSLHPAVPAGRAAPALPLHPRRLERLRRDGARGGRVLRRRASPSIRSAPARSAWRSGGAARSSPSIATRTIARSATTASPAADDAVGQALLARFKGRELPMIDRVEVSIIEESQPRWLSFLNSEIDVLMSVPLEFAAQAAPGGKLAPWLAKRGVRMDRFANADRTLYYFNMEDPIVGGYTPEKVALRRAISLATDVDARDRAGPARPGDPGAIAGGAGRLVGYDPTYRSENSVYSPARAKALLDLYGYVDRDGDGWRELPDGKPLVLEYATTPDALSRQFDELWKKNMDAIGIRLEMRTAKWPEQLKAARAGQLMIWQLGYSSSSPDVQDGLQTLYGPAAGGQNLSRFKHAALRRDLPQACSRCPTARSGWR